MNPPTDAQIAAAVAARIQGVDLLASLRGSSVPKAPEGVIVIPSGAFGSKTGIIQVCNQADVPCVRMMTSNGKQLGAAILATDYERLTHFAANLWTEQFND